MIYLQENEADEAIREQVQCGSSDPLGLLHQIEAGDEITHPSAKR
jgi:hypothetical protein